MRLIGESAPQRHSGKPSALFERRASMKGCTAKFIGRVGAELEVEEGGKAARFTALNALAVAQSHLGSLNRGTRILRLGVMIASSGDVRDQLGTPVVRCPLVRTSDNCEVYDLCPRTFVIAQ
jgi:hypothetical protein